MQRCPCCKARLKEAVYCPRCKADLEEIIRVQHLARGWFKKAIDYYLLNDRQACVDALNQSLKLQRTESVFYFRAFVLERQGQTLLVRLQGFVHYVITRSRQVVSRLLKNL